MKNWFRSSLISCLFQFIVICWMWWFNRHNHFEVAIMATLVTINLFFLTKINQKVKERNFWNEQLLDAIPFPISVTDMNMNWTFLNSAATTPLNVTRNDVMGQQCKNWGANICETDECGIACLRANKPETFFHQWDKDFRVETRYLRDLKGTKIGHVEVVQEITDKVALKDIYFKVEKISSKVSESAFQVNESSQTLSQGATEQAASLEEISSSLNEIESQSRNNAKYAAQASNFSDEAKTSVQSASEKMEKMDSAMKEINDASIAISKILKVIDEIAFQTNLLALNAAVEAARAGQHGKGFAVVAEEVRNLAGRSAKAAAETAGIIDGSTKKILLGNDIAASCVEALDLIVDKILQIDTMAKEIDTSSNEQAKGISQILEGFEQIEQVVLLNTSTAEETAASAEELSAQAKNMKVELKAIRNIEGIFDDKDHDIEVKDEEYVSLSSNDNLLKLPAAT